jgi:hypothetical protein
VHGNRRDKETKMELRNWQVFYIVIKFIRVDYCLGYSNRLTRPLIMLLRQAGQYFKFSDELLPGLSGIV